MAIYSVVVVCLMYWSYTQEDQGLGIVAYQTDAGTHLTNSSNLMILRGLSTLQILRAAQIRQLLLSVHSLRISQVQTIGTPQILP
jgi:hypothetical protein